MAALNFLTGISKRNEGAPVWGGGGCLANNDRRIEPKKERERTRDLTKRRKVEIVGKKIMYGTKSILKLWGKQKKGEQNFHHFILDKIRMNYEQIIVFIAQQNQYFYNSDFDT